MPNPRTNQPRRKTTDEQVKVIRENRKGLTRRKLAEETQSAYVREMVDFVLSASDRSFLTPK